MVHGCGIMRSLTSMLLWRRVSRRKPHSSSSASRAEKNLEKREKNKHLLNNN